MCLEVVFGVCHKLRVDSNKLLGGQRPVEMNASIVENTVVLSRLIDFRDASPLAPFLPAEPQFASGDNFLRNRSPLRYARGAVDTS